jgi:cyclohexadieny/prephenate dehydrogenase
LAVFAWLKHVLEQLTILAPGLLGGSVARTARARSLAKRIVIWARRPEARIQLRAQPWCDAAPDTIEEAVATASLVVLAPPVDRIVTMAEEIAPALPAGAIVTDVGSVKGDIARRAHQALRKDTHFVGSHPMAGSEKTGWENATDTLFNQRTCFVTPLPDTDAAATALVVRFWQDTGMNVATVSPDEHDEIVAHISHLPQVIASTLCAFLAGKNPAWRDFAGGGLRDTTRIAGSDATMWRAIFEHNRDEILRALRQYEDALHAFQTALANRNYPELVSQLQRGKAYRDQFRLPPQ